MGLREAASCFVIFLLSVSVVRADPWGVTCTPTQICAVKGSKVQIRCTYSHPSRIDDHDVAVEKTFWFTKGQDGEPVDLREASEYTGRVKYDCRNKACTLTITDLRDSDSAVYQFRFTTNHRAGSFTGSTGVSLSVTGVQVIITKSSACRTGDCSIVECRTSCPPTPSLSYIWYKNGKKTTGEKSYRANFYSRDSISCAVRGHEDFPSAPVYAPKVPLVQLSQPGDILKDSSVSLTCSSDANPPPAYTWYKENQTLLNRAAQLVFSSIPLSDSGEYYCTAENALGKTASKPVLINVKYAPKPPSVSVSPSGEIMEGSSVTLTCSSDANPAAHYTWYKEDEDSPKASGQNFTITDITAEHGGKYQCEAQNTHGRSNTTLHLTVGAGAWKSAVTGTTTALLLVVVLLAVFLWIRRNKSFTQQRECGERPEDRAQIPAAAHTRPAEPHDDVHYASVCFTQNPADAIYCNIGRVQPQRETEEDEEEEAEYSAVRFDSATGTRREEEGDDPSAVYSTVTKH